MSEEKVYVGAITEAVKNTIRNKTAYGLPDRPSAMGMKADEIKKAFWSPVIDDNDRDCVIKELERVIKEVNAAFKLAYVDIGNIKLSKGEYDAKTNEFVLKLAGDGEESIRIDATPLLDKIAVDGDTLECETDASGAMVFKLKDDFMVLITKVPQTVMSNIAIHNTDKAAHEEAFEVHNSDTGAHSDIRGEILAQYNELYGLLSGRSGYFEDNRVLASKTSPPRTMSRALLTEIHGRSFIGYQFYEGAATKYRGVDFQNSDIIEYRAEYGRTSIPCGDARAWSPADVFVAAEKTADSNVLYWYTEGKGANLQHIDDGTLGATGLKGVSAISFRIVLTKIDGVNCMPCEFRFKAAPNSAGYTQTIAPVCVDGVGDVYLSGGYYFGNLYYSDVDIAGTINFSKTSRDYTITYFYPNTSSKYKNNIAYYKATCQCHASFANSQEVSNTLSQSGYFVATQYTSYSGIGIKYFATYNGEFFAKEHFLHSKVQKVTAMGQSIQSLVIPEAVKSIVGYGMGYGDCTNYIDVEHGKFIQRCAHGDKIPSGATEVARTGGDGPTEYLYQLAKPVVTDVSKYIGADACLWDIGDKGVTFFISTDTDIAVKSVIIFQIAEEE